MANAVKLWESYEDICAHRARWDQRQFIEGNFERADNIFECGTTQCLAGFRCLRDGLLPTLVKRGGPIEVSRLTFVDPSDGSTHYADDWASASFELDSDGYEASLLFYSTANKLDQLREHIRLVINGYIDR